MASNWKGNQYRAQNAGGPPEQMNWGDQITALLSGLLPTSGAKVTTGGGGTLAGGGRFAGNPAVMKAIGNMGTVGKVAAPLAGAYAIVDAVSEFADGDPVLKNAAEATGKLGGGLAGLAGGAALGASIGSVVPVVGTGIGGLVGGGLGYLGMSNAGKGLGGGIYELLSGGADGRRRRREMDEAQHQAQMKVVAKRIGLPVVEEAQMLAFLDDQRRAELDNKLAYERAFGNTANQSLLDAQRSAEIQQLALLSQL